MSTCPVALVQSHLSPPLSRRFSLLEDLSPWIQCPLQRLPIREVAQTTQPSDRLHAREDPTARRAHLFCQSYELTVGMPSSESSSGGAAGPRIADLGGRPCLASPTRLFRRDTFVGNG